MDFRSLTFTDVSRHFGRRRVLNKISFRCDAGEIVALLGANGAGKSTLLAIAATLLAPSAGVVQYGDATCGSEPSFVRVSASLVTTSSSILSCRRSKTLRSSLVPTRCVTSIGPVKVALERAGLDERDDPAGRFSRGMRQRLALERALLHDPRLVLLDEPFTGLDDAATMALRARLADLKAAGCIVLLATHDLETIDGVADRAILLRGGRLISIDDGARVVARSLSTGQS